MSVAELSLFEPSETGDDDTRITRSALIDRNTILLSTTAGPAAETSAVFGRGFENGLVTLVRRLMGPR